MTTSWQECFNYNKKIILENNDTFNVYEFIGSKVSSNDNCDLLPLFIFHHGAGLSALSFSLTVKTLKKMYGENVILMAYDARGHSETKTIDDKNYSLKTLADDLVRLFHKLYSDKNYDLVLVGHSLGGSVVVEAAKIFLEQKINILGLAVIDVVEGTALEALSYMKQLIATRPTNFKTEKDAIDWAYVLSNSLTFRIKTGTVRNMESAEISIPPQLIFSEPNQNYVWRTNLSETCAFWNEWFKDLSEKFLATKAAKLLILAGTERLDKSLTIGQIQGKFQMQIIPNTGHLIHEDDPLKMAEVLYEFWKRNSKLFLPEPIRKKFLQQNLTK